VVVLQEFPGPAPPSRLADEGAPTAISLPNGTPHVSRHVSPALDGPCPATGGRTRLALYELGDECIERPVDDLGYISRWNGMTEQSLGLTKLVVGRSFDCQPDRKR
jgi:hypothetical protein